MTETEAMVGEWQRFRETVKTKVPPDTWQTWLEPLELDEAGGSGLSLIAPSEFHARWVTDKHLEVLTGAADAVYGPEASVVLEGRPTNSAPEFSDDLDGRSPPSPAGAETPNSHGIGDTRPIGKYTFDNFVVGQSNRFAHAAAMAVAEQPGGNYNPLFIYGGAGLGKTHLLHAVGHHSLELAPAVRVRYISSENFFNEFIDGIRRKRMDAFKARYRTIDVLLLDDVQFLEGKEQILEEFFHTFNSLYESDKQMVFTSDRSPKGLRTLEDRVRSRFEWGLLTDIQPPDVETRLAILRKNAERNPQQVPEAVLEFIAVQVKDNIRELEGAMTRVTAFAALTSEPVDLTMARQVLRDLDPDSGPRPVAADEIISRSAAAYGYTPTDLAGPSRKHPLVLSRQIAMYLCREHTDLSLPKIGRLFGGRDHTTVMHAIDKIQRLITTDREVFDRVTSLTQDLRTT